MAPVNSCRRGATGSYEAAEPPALTKHRPCPGTCGIALARDRSARIPERRPGSPRYRQRSFAAAPEWRTAGSRRSGGAPRQKATIAINTPRGKVIALEWLAGPGCQRKLAATGS